MDHFNIHFTPFFYILAAIIKIMPTLPWYLLVHVVALSAFCETFHRICRKVLPHQHWTIMLLNLVVIFNPYLMAANLYPHFEIFGALFLALFTLLTISNRRRMALIFLLLAMTVKQDIWIYGFVLSAMIFIGPNKYYAICCGGVCLLYGALFANMGYQYWYPHHLNRMQDIWSFATSQVDAMIYFAQHLGPTMRNMFSGSSRSLLLTLFLIPIFSMQGWLAMSVLYLWVNATAIERSSLAFYYSLPALTLLAIAMPYSIINIFGMINRLGRVAILGDFIKRQSANRKLFCAGSLVLVIVVAIFNAISPPKSLELSPHLKSVFARHLTRRDLHLISLIGKWTSEPTKSVYANFAIAAYVPHHKDLYISHLDGRDLMAGSIRPDIVILDMLLPDFGPTSAQEVDRKLREVAQWHHSFSEDGFEVYE